MVGRVVSAGGVTAGMCTEECALGISVGVDVKGRAISLLVCGSDRDM